MNEQTSVGRSILTAFVSNHILRLLEWVPKPPPQISQTKIKQSSNIQIKSTEIVLTHFGI